MATLGNLSSDVAAATTPRIVKLTLALPDPQGGAPTPTEADIALLPLSPDGRGKARRAAEALRQRVGGEFGDAPDLGRRVPVSVCLAAMRDPEDLRRAFVDGKNTDTFRRLLSRRRTARRADQEYRRLIRSEYAEVVATLTASGRGRKSLFPKAPA